ncbi:MAG: HAD family hydrolase [Dehalococcoidia bacterium]
MYKAVLFDLFGTLIQAPPMTKYNQMVAEIAGILNQPLDSFKDPWMSINDGRLDGSFGSSEGDILAVAELVGAEVSESQMAQCMDMRRSTTGEFLKPKDGAIEMLEELRQMGCSLGLVTDCVYDVPAIWPDTQFAGYFTATHFSCETHVRKPDSRTYLGVLETLEISASVALFVGDGGSDELNGAVRAGLDALMIADILETVGNTLRVGVTEWSGPAAASMPEITRYVRENS